MGTLSFEYKKIDHGVEIEKYIGSESIVDVPSRIGGEPVIKIKAGAFAESKNIQRIDLPFSMKEFSLDAFVGCVGLKEISWNYRRILFDSNTVKVDYDKDIHLPPALLSR